MKDHEKARLVNELTALAKDFSGAQQLRERIARCVLPAIDAAIASEREGCKRACAALEVHDVCHPGTAFAVQEMCMNAIVMRANVKLTGRAEGRRRAPPLGAPVQRRVREQEVTSMEHLYYVRRAKSKTGIDRHDTLHAADNDKTFCGKELNEMWFIEPAVRLKPEDVNCISCRRALRSNA